MCSRLDLMSRHSVPCSASVNCGQHVRHQRPLPDQECAFHPLACRHATAAPNAAQCIPHADIRVALCTYVCSFNWQSWLTVCWNFLLGVEEMLPGILPQLGPEGLQELSKKAVSDLCTYPHVVDKSIGFSDMHRHGRPDCRGWAPKACRSSARRR